MKKLHKLTLGAAMTLFSLTACNDESMLPEVPQVNEPQNPEMCVLSADDFRWEGADSRTSISIEDNYVKFAWTAGDLVGILPDQGAQVYFTIPEPEEGVDMTNKASFDGGAWALRPQNDYAAYYPFVKDFDLSRTEVPVDYTGQKQTGTTYDHIGAYDYMGARAVTTNEQGAGVTFDFDHVGALVLLQFTVPEADTKLNSVTLSADGVKFTTKGTYSLASAKEAGFPITPTTTSPEMTVELDYTTQEAGEQVTVYMMCAPVDLSDKDVNICVSYGNGEYVLDYTAEGKNLEAANAYALTAVDDAMVIRSAMEIEDASIFANDIKNVLGECTKLRFVPGSSVTSEKLIYTDANGVSAYAVLSGEWLEIHTSAKKFKFLGSCSYMFQGCSSLTELDLSGWDTQNVTDMSRMFEGCSNLGTLTLNNWNTGNVTNMRYMFNSCSNLVTLTLDNWDTQNVTDMSYMFSSCSNLGTLTLNNWNTGKVTNMSCMFNGCSNLKTLTLDNWNTQNVEDMSDMFSSCSNLTTLTLDNWDTQNVEDMSSMFNSCSNLVTLTLDNWETQNVTNMSSMFLGCSNLGTLTLDNWDTQNVEDMSSMFLGCSNLETLTLDNWNTQNVTNMSAMFWGCSNLETLDLSGWDTSSVTDMSVMFQSCSALGTLTFGDNWKTQKVTNMSYMFSVCSELTELNLSGWETQNVTNMSAMFYSCFALNNLDLTSFTFKAEGCEYADMFNSLGYYSYEANSNTPVAKIHVTKAGYDVLVGTTYDLGLNYATLDLALPTTDPVEMEDWN